MLAMLSTLTRHRIGQAKIWAFQSQGLVRRQA